MSLVERRCLKPDCIQIFRCTENSLMRFCCIEHDPEPKKVAGYWRPDWSGSKEEYAEMRKDLAKFYVEGLRGLALSTKLNELGHRHPRGGPVTTRYVIGYCGNHLNEGAPRPVQKKPKAVPPPDDLDKLDKEIDACFEVVQEVSDTMRPTVKRVLGIARQIEESEKDLKELYSELSSLVVQ